MLYRFFLIGVATLLCVCCASKNDEISELTFDLVISDSLDLKLPRDVYHPLSDDSYFWSHDDVSFSYLVEGGLDSLFIYRFFFSGEWNKTTLFPQGPNQVYGAGAFTFINDSSFYYFPGVVSKILKMNISGETLESYDYSYLRLERIRRNNNQSNIFWNDSIIGFDIAEYRPLEEVSTFLEASIYGVYDFDTLSGIINYPEEFHGKVWSSNDVDRSSLVVGDSIYFNFSKSSYIYVYGFDGKEIAKKKLGSPHIKESQSGRVEDAQVNLIRRENNGYYPQMVYDKWRGLFYRIGIYYKSSQEVETIMDLAKVAKSRTMSVTTFNSNLDLIAYNEFSIKSHLDHRLCFVTPNGLFFLNRNYNSDDDLRFYQLNLVKKATN
ncbi:DUF4221 family protein [Roseivirga echinicomitans]|uniref:DUF4221 domain-containing protein n=1 Tax=Roseivirga echinicomitans TaxID=296218 RepID=A0A150XE61_9BACT|nr:DUF4221 family protein [Roseivirga echinicomitans]KYG76991.1 hypothetical protein AWN68_18385 [Roseivirga echinicomitans]